ncbi:MAG: glycosyltransferase, partial [Bacteroidales bacterium]|nr:glycosyltransferase [Bacteroidales bacterium]
YFAGSIARLFKVPYIPLLHGGDLPRRLAKSKRVCQRLFNHSYANVAVSGYLKHEFEERGINVTLIPNTINIKDYPFKLREKMRPRLLWVRSFHRQYNPNMAADVLKELLKTHPDAELCMVGPDKDGSMEEFKNYVEGKDLADHVTITGKLSKQDWIDLSSDYDFFINTTNVDNTPVSVVEAMALGLCVVSTNPGGIPYLLSDDVDASLVDVDDSVGMAERIDVIIASPEKGRKYSTLAREKAESFDSELVMDLWKMLLT